MSQADIIGDLRQLILRAAPDPALAEPVKFCGEDEALDRFIPFSSVILLGVVVAVEDRFHITITGRDMALACQKGASLRSLATMITDLQENG